MDECIDRKDIGGYTFIWWRPWCNGAWDINEIGH